MDEEEWQALREVLAHFPHVRRAVLFGSRAKGTNKPFSDVDIALMGDALTLVDLQGVMREVDAMSLTSVFMSVYTMQNSGVTLTAVAWRYFLHGKIRSCLQDKAISCKYTCEYFHVFARCAFKIGAVIPH